ncbi:MAG TPA: hypothetical protein VEA69_09700 [Tepidisphaeraceae bacterium]|nr:hypothetical protein [Tepidisphaeraceae bacterium]
MQCNIDSRGKAVRLRNGLILLAAGALVAALWAWPTGATVAWATAGAMAVGGAFMVFEGWAGWCVLRAMGIKTRI